MSRECQEKNAKGLTMVAVGMNKSAEQYLILDDTTREELASGKYRDQRREFFGKVTSAPADAKTPAGTSATATATASPASSPARKAPAPRRQPWTRSQERLALLYNEQGLRPDEIAQKLGLSTYNVTQIILNRRSRGKL
jgi:hypothetical protein